MNPGSFVPSAAFQLFDIWGTASIIEAAPFHECERRHLLGLWWSRAAREAWPHITPFCRQVFWRHLGLMWTHFRSTPGTGVTSILVHYNGNTVEQRVMKVQLRFSEKFITGQSIENSTLKFYKCKFIVPYPVHAFFSNCSFSETDFILCIPSLPFAIRPFSSHVIGTYSMPSCPITWQKNCNDRGSLEPGFGHSSEEMKKSRVTI